MRPGTWRHLLSAALVSLFLTATASACPNCKEAVSAQPEDVAKVARGYNWSILLMLSMPALLMGTGAFLVHRAVKLGKMPEF